MSEGDADGIEITTHGREHFVHMREGGVSWRFWAEWEPSSAGVEQTLVVWVDDAPPDRHVHLAKVVSERLARRAVRHRVVRWVPRTVTEAQRARALDRLRALGERPELLADGSLMLRSRRGSTHSAEVFGLTGIAMGKAGTEECLEAHPWSFTIPVPPDHEAGKQPG